MSIIHVITITGPFSETAINVFPLNGQLSAQNRVESRLLNMMRTFHSRGPYAKPPRASMTGPTDGRLGGAYAPERCPNWKGRGDK